MKKNMEGKGTFWFQYVAITADHEHGEEVQHSQREKL